MRRLFFFRQVFILPAGAGGENGLHLLQRKVYRGKRLGPQQRSGRHRRKKTPPHETILTVDGIRKIKLICSTRIGVNVRSTVATYSNVHDELCRVFAETA